MKKIRLICRNISQTLWHQNTTRKSSKMRFNLTNIHKQIIIPFPRHFSHAIFQMKISQITLHRNYTFTQYIWSCDQKELQPPSFSCVESYFRSSLSVIVRKHITYPTYCNIELLLPPFLFSLYHFSYSNSLFTIYNVSWYCVWKTKDWKCDDNIQHTLVEKRNVLKYECVSRYSPQIERGRPSDYSPMLL